MAEKPGPYDRPAAWPEADPTAVYSYCFAVWPDEQSPRWTRPVYDLFRAMMTRTQMEFTERAFNDFREELAKVGLTLREIERWPHLGIQAIH